MPGEGIDAAALGLRFALAFVFLIAAIPKLFGRAELERAVANYALVPSSLVAIVAAWLPRLELGLAFALFLGVAVVPVAAGAAVLLLAFATVVALNLARGRRIDCGCQGSVAPRRIGWGLVTADLSLAAAAVAVAIASPRHLGVDWLGVSGRSSLSIDEGVAILTIAGGLVLTKQLISSWRALHAASRGTHIRQRGGFA